MKTASLPANRATRRYNAFGQYMKDLFGQAVYKVNVDAGFTCPNRDGTVSVGGCIYCNNDSFRPSACTSTASVRDQIETGIPYLRRRYGAEKFIVYFQPFTNTYAPVGTLERLYREALEQPGVVGLAIGTRPDCVDEEKITLLEELAMDRFILVEYGLQSIHDRTLKFINRGHDYACFKRALAMTAGRGIKIGAHLILGFPTETRDDMLAMADELSGLPLGFRSFTSFRSSGTRLLRTCMRPSRLPRWAMRNISRWLPISSSSSRRTSCSSVCSPRRRMIFSSRRSGTNHGASS